MELKNTKSKAKKVLVKSPKILSRVDSFIESDSIEIPTPKEGDKKEILNGQNHNIYIEKDEAIIIEHDNDKNSYLDLSKKPHKSLSKRIYFINMIKERKRFIFNSIPWILLIVLLLVLFFLWSQLSDIKKDPLKAAQVESNEVIGAISEIMVLPTGEIPQIATLTEDDISKVKTQSFFINAKVGDKLLVYSVARKVILYDPQINKIIEVANLDATADNQSEPSLIK